MRKPLLILLSPIAVMLLGLILLTAFGWAAGAWLAGIGFLAFAIVAFAKSMGLSMFSSDVPDDF